MCDQIVGKAILTFNAAFSKHLLDLEFCTFLDGGVKPLTLEGQEKINLLYPAILFENLGQKSVL